MKYLGNVPAVFHFEWKRSITTSRIAWWLVLALFPAGIMLLMRVNEAEPPRPVLAGMLFLLIPMLICMLGVFLWSTPAVSTELERGSWVYLAVRPDGGTAVLLGKYLLAISWTIPAALVGLTLALIVAPEVQPVPTTQQAAQELEDVSRIRIWLSLSALSCLSTLSYAAVYSVIGVLFPRRAMVVAVAYTLIFEFIIGFVPAMINKLTIQFRLRSLCIEWLQIPLPGQGSEMDLSGLVNGAPAWHNILILMLMTLAFLASAVFVLRLRELAGTADSQD